MRGGSLQQAAAILVEEWRDAHLADLRRRLAHLPGHVTEHALDRLQGGIDAGASMDYDDAEAEEIALEIGKSEAAPFFSPECIGDNCANCPDASNHARPHPALGDCGCDCHR